MLFRSVLARICESHHGVTERATLSGSGLISTDEDLSLVKEWADIGPGKANREIALGRIEFDEVSNHDY